MGGVGLGWGWWVVCWVGEVDWWVGVREWECWEGEEEQGGCSNTRFKLKLNQEGQRLRNADMGCVTVMRPESRPGPCTSIYIIDISCECMNPKDASVLRGLK